MPRKRLRFLSICMVIAMLSSTFSFALPLEESKAADPFEEMQDNVISVPLGSADLQQQEEQSEESSFWSVLDGQILESDTVIIDDGKTNRYIVKYKENRQAQFLDKADGLVTEAEDFNPSVVLESGMLSVYQEDAGLKVQPILPRDTAIEGIAVEAEAIEVTSANMQVLILGEKMLPSEFAEELSVLGADTDIEYIQPDFELSLDSVGLTVVEDPLGTAARDDLQTETALPVEGELEPPVESPLVSEVPSGSSEPAEEPEPPSEEVPADLEPELEVDPETEIELEPETEIEEKRTILVAVIDTGIDTDHEIFDGYLHEDTPDTGTDALSYAHGTHIGGIIVNIAKEMGAEITILPIKVFDHGNAYTSDIIAAIEYASGMGADIINCSFGSVQYNQALYETMAATDALFVCAVGNNRRDFDKTPSYPAGYDLPNVISVASVNGDDGFSYFSNYGSGSIDLAARGRDVYSALPGNKYGTMTGTSMSAAYVTGAAAAALYEEDLTTGELKAQVLDGADRLSNLGNKVVDGRRLNAANAVAGVLGASLTLNPADDFDVHGYQRTDEENWQLFSSLEIVQVVAGSSYSLALASDGTVWAWGLNYYGQLGDGTSDNKGTPVQVIGLTDIVTIAGGYGHNLAADSLGNVWAWGYNYYGQLGDSTKTDRTCPVQISGLQNIIGIAVGQNHSVALDNTGYTWTWGDNRSMQLGVGNVMIKSVINPIQLYTVQNFVSITAGANHNLAIDNNGKIWAWGQNLNGQLGLGSLSTIYVPTLISSLSNVVSIEAGSTHSLALDSNGYVWSWGSNANGQIGISGVGTFENRVSPLRISNLNGIVSISAGVNYNMALKNDGTMWAWGRNQYGQLGDGTSTNQVVPVHVNSWDDAISVDVGGDHTVILREDGTIWSWGQNSSGQLGIKTIPDRTTPEKLEDMSDVTSVIAGGSYSLAMKNDGTVWSWGRNFEGQLGDGTTVGKNSPIQVHNANDFIAIAAGACNMAFDTDGHVWLWGKTADGLFGSQYPSPIMTPMQYSGLENIVAVAPSGNFRLALKNNGTVWAWGYNGYGQLGRGNTANSFSPVQSTITNVKSIAVGSLHCLALKNDGTVWTWGNNTYEQLGVGNTTMRNVPAQVSGLSNIVAIDAGGYSSLAIDSSGRVWMWGQNQYGQLGDGTTTQKASPTQVSGLSNIISASTSGIHTLAIDSYGDVWAWGYNAQSQLGDGTTTNQRAPIKIEELSNATSVSAGGGHSMALDNDGNIFIWGDDSQGQLGNGWIDKSIVPVQVAMPILQDLNSPTTLAFDQSSYSASVPVLGTSIVQVIATAYDENDLIVEDATITYSLVPSYTGVSIDEVTGLVTVSSVTVPGTVTVKAICGEISETVSLMLQNPVIEPPPPTTISFNQSSYTTTIPATGTSTIQVSAKAYDENNLEVTGASATYSLASPYTGVSIDAATGLITILSTAELGTVTIKAVCGTLEAAADLTLYTPSSGAALDLDIQENARIHIALTATNQSDLSSTVFTVTYDHTKLQLLDTAAQVYDVQITTGAIGGTGLTVTDLSEGTIKFTLSKSLPLGKQWSGVITVLQFKALTTGTASISAS